MLKEEIKTQLSSLGLDVEKLQAAMIDEAEVDFDIPKLFSDAQLKDQLSIFGKNRFDEGKQAMGEILAKSYKTKYGLEIEGKNLDDVIEAYGAKKFNEAKPDEGAKELQRNFTDLQGKYTTLEEQLAAKDAEVESKVFEITLKQGLLNATPDKLKIGNSDAVDLYLLKTQVKRDNGRDVVVVDGEIQKDNLLNPIAPTDHYKAWLDKKGYTIKDGMGGGDSGSGSSPKFTTAAEFYAWCQKEGKDAMSGEMQKYYLANKS